MGELEHSRAFLREGVGEVDLLAHGEEVEGGPSLALAGEDPLQEGVEHLDGTGEEEEGQTTSLKPLPAVDWPLGCHHDAQQSRR